MPTDEEIQKILDDLKFEQTMSMIRLLALNLTKDTKRESIPKGTLTWIIRELDDPNLFAKRFSPDPIRTKITYIHLIEFFGMYVGYDARLDYFVYWTP